MKIVNLPAKYWTAIMGTRQSERIVLLSYEHCKTQWEQLRRSWMFPKTHLITVIRRPEKNQTNSYPNFVYYVCWEPHGLFTGKHGRLKKT